MLSSLQYPGGHKACAMNRTNSYPNRYYVKYASMVDCPQDYEPSIRIVFLEAHVFFNQSFLCHIQGLWLVRVCFYITPDKIAFLDRVRLSQQTLGED